jgi:glycosyltransferase involved in cell wall biosynthesis
MHSNELPVAGARRIGVIANYAVSIINFRGPLVREMVQRGAVVYALAPDYDESTRAGVRALGAVPVDASLSRAGMNPLRDACDTILLARQLRSLKLDTTFAYYIKPVIYGTLAAALAGIPHRFAMIEGAGYVFTDQAKPTLRRRLLRHMVSTLYRAALSRAGHVFMLNPDDRALFVNARMVSEDKVQLLNGIGLELAHYAPAALPAGAPLFLFIGRMLREKGIHDFIAAAREVKNCHPDVRFVVLGEIDANPGSLAEADVRSWVAEGIVEWPGQVADVRPWIALASVFVLPSYREGLPRSTQEAMAMGRAVITTDVPGCRSTVQHDVNGFIVPVRDPQALAAAMQKFISKPALTVSMGEASLTFARARYDVHKVNDVILEAMGL